MRVYISIKYIINLIVYLYICFRIISVVNKKKTNLMRREFKHKPCRIKCVLCHTAINSYFGTTFFYRPTRECRSAPASVHDRQQNMAYHLCVQNLPLIISWQLA